MGCGSQSITSILLYCNRISLNCSRAQKQVPALSERMLWDELKCNGCSRPCNLWIALEHNFYRSNTVFRNQKYSETKGHTHQLGDDNMCYHFELRLWPNEAFTWGYLTKADRPIKQAPRWLVVDLEEFTVKWAGQSTLCLTSLASDDRSLAVSTVITSN